MHKYKRIIFYLLIWGMLLLGLNSCGLPKGMSPPSNEPGAEESADVEPPISEDSEQGEDPDEGGETFDISAPGDFMECPQAGQPLYLEVDHAVTLNYEEMSLSHFLHQGYVHLEMLEGGKIGTSGPGSLKYSIEGVMGPECSISGEGQVTVTVEGTCEYGVVKLKIDEDWQALSGVMECDFDGEKSIVPFQAPSVGSMPNHGPDGEGEVFLLTEGDEGYLVMRPFAKGQGYHNWTLYTTTIPTLPLVP
jgi:hypothetical protein